jgi:hypothetical protein
VQLLMVLGCYTGDFNSQEPPVKEADHGPACCCNTYMCWYIPMTNGKLPQQLHEIAPLNKTLQ